MGLNKKGQFAGSNNAVTLVVGVLFALIIGAFILLTVVNKGDYTAAMNTISDFFTDVLGPLLKFILIPGNTANGNEFLIVLTFILMFVIVTGTLDSMNLFGGVNSTNRVLNLVIGLIVSIIGVRFMPADMWGSLTDPASALVATMLLGIPFAAFFFISMKIRSIPARKILWLFYIIFLSYLILRREGAWTQTGFAWLYLGFLAAAFAMLFLDGTFRNLFYKDKAHREMVDSLSKINAIQRYNIRKQVEKWEKILADPSATPADRGLAKMQLTNLQKLYGDLSLI
jgi:uncharacterized membrane protein (DUF441 family)